MSADLIVGWATVAAVSLYALRHAWIRLMAALDADFNRRVAKALDTVNAEPITWDEWLASEPLPVFGPATRDYLAEQLGPQVVAEAEEMLRGDVA